MKLPKFSGSSAKPFLLRSSFVMCERRGKFAGRLVEKIVSKFHSAIQNAVRVPEVAVMLVCVSPGQQVV